MNRHNLWGAQYYEPCFIEEEAESCGNELTQKVLEIIRGTGFKDKSSKWWAYRLTMVLYILKHFGFWVWNKATYYKLA